MEQWKIIDGSQYEVSNAGRVRNVSTGRILAPRPHTNGYIRVCLGSQREEYVHRLVCAAFHGPCPQGFECDHVNRQRSDNRAENLRWTSPEENKRHREFPIGEKHWNSRLTANDVTEIRRLLPHHNNVQIGRHFGVHRRTISDIRNGRTWCHGN